MLADRRLNRLNGATRECLERCYQSGNWLDCLANYAQRLRADGWTAEDIDEVEATVRRILRAVAESESFHPARMPSAGQSADMAST